MRYEMTEVVRDIKGDGNPFVCRLSNGWVRIGYHGLAAKDAPYPEFLDLANRATELSDAEFEVAVELTLAAVEPPATSIRIV